MSPRADEICAKMKQELSFFRFLDEQDAEILAAALDCRELAGGETLWREGDPCGHIAFIISGRLEEKKETEFAGKQVVVGVYSPGTIIGELCLLDGRPRPVTVTALENAELLLLSREGFDRLLAEHPLLGVKLLKGMLLAVGTRLRKSFDRLAAIF